MQLKMLIWFFGDNDDGMSFFPLSKNRGILAVNNEYINPEIMFNHHGKNLSKEDVLYEQASVGVSILEIEKKGDDWTVVLDSKYNRRIDANTKMQVSGAAKKEVLKNEKFVYGTFANCANGQTPWGTYITCEENFDDFFGSSDENLEFNDAFKRYGFNKTSLYGWEKFDERFDLAKNIDEANRFGWIVEINPFDAKSTPIKRTSLGRFKHENAEIIVEKDGSVIVYMGDDEMNEFIYKFVSKHKYKKGADTSKILDEGTLYVGQFNGNVYGQILKWMPKNSHKDDDFTWEIFALAGNPDNQQGLYKGSNNITSENKFNSPDGLKFDRDGRLWIQTDGSYSNKDEYEGMGNNCMLAANPKTGEIRRFLTGPIACELTGIAFSEDYTTMFVGIQHPGEGLKGSTFPYGKTPRSSVMMIRKLDGGVIGS